MAVFLSSKILGRYVQGIPKVVFVHGINDTSRSFEAVAACLCDLRCVLFDRRGWGTSAHVLPRASTSAEHADDLSEVIGEEPATVIGHSIGGVVALHAAVRHSNKVASLGLYEPAVHWAEWWSDEDNAPVRAAAEGAVEQSSHASVAATEAEPGAYRSDLLSSLNERIDLARVEAPVVIGYGSDSTAGHRRSALSLAQALGADVMVIQGARHSAHKTHPGQFARLVRLAVSKTGVSDTGVSATTSPMGATGDPGRGTAVDEQPLD